MVMLDSMILIALNLYVLATSTVRCHMGTNSRNCAVIFPFMIAACNPEFEWPNDVVDAIVESDLTIAGCSTRDNGQLECLEQA